MGSRARKMILGGWVVLMVCLLAAGGAWAKTYNLRAAAGSVTMPDGEVITIWGFADCGEDPDPLDADPCPSNPDPTLPGPELDVPSGESLVINLKNNLPEPVSIIMGGQRIIPVVTGSQAPQDMGKAYTYEIPSGASGAYVLTTPMPGTYLYESGSNQSKQVQMGLYGALIVRPAGYDPNSNPIAYLSPTSPNPSLYDREVVLLLSDIDPYWHAAVAAGQPYNAVYFSPKYWLINGKAYPDTQEVLAKTGETVLLRYLNAGSQDHVMVIQGHSQLGIADDGNLVTHPQMIDTVVMNPGQTRDLILQPSTLGVYPLFDRRLDVTNRDAFPGGMISMIRVLDSALSEVSILSTAPTLATEGQHYVYDLVAADPLNLSASLSYTVMTGPAGMAMDSKGRISWNPTSSDASVTAGLHHVTVKVSNNPLILTCPDPDTDPNVECQSFDVYVNSNPVIASISNQTVAAGSPFSLAAGAYTSDADTDPLKYSLFDVFVPVTIDPATGIISGTPTESQVGTYTIQVQASDGRGGIGGQSFQLTVTSLLTPVPPPPGGGGGTGMNTVTISPVKYGTGTPITNFKFIVNLDNTPFVDPDAIPPCNPCPGTHQYESNSPVAAAGTVKNGIFLVEDLSVTTPPNNGNGSCDPGEVCIPGSLTLPDGRYLVTVLAGQFDPTNDIPDDLEMRNGGVYKMDGKHFAVSGGATVAVEVQLPADPLPLSQVTVQVFHDNRPVSGAWDFLGTAEGPPMRNGVVDHFKIILRDALGDVSTDALGNPICTQYDGLGNPIPGTGGVCLTDDNGFIAIKNMPPDRYDVDALPPEGSGWIQTTTIEGTKGIETWVQEGNSGLLPETLGIYGLKAFTVMHGFIHPCTFGDTTDDCPTNDTTGTGVIYGQVRKLEPARPPFLHPDQAGAPVHYPWIALNNMSGGGEQVALVRGDENGNFTINNVPDGSYQAVIWDDPQDYIITTYVVSMPQAGSRNVELTNPIFGGLIVPDWWSTLHGMVFLDKNENGVQDAGEPGLPGEYVEVRHRDGSLYSSTITDLTGHYLFREFFPSLHFEVAGIGYSRLGDTGLHRVSGEGLSLFGEAPVEDQVDLGPELVIGTLGWEGETNRIDWGKKPYPLSNPDTITPINGGISGVVWYATTRNEEDIRFAAADDWEPGVPDLYLDLYERVVDPATGKTKMDPNTGAAIKGRHLGRVITDHYQRDGLHPADCNILDPNTGAPTIDPNCTEQLRTWNQIKPAAYDGAYQFFFDCSDPDNPNQLIDPDNPPPGKQCRPIPPGTYLVELEMPEHYLLVTENDRNVLNQGDTFVQPLREVPRCVGPLYAVVDPDQPDYIPPPAPPTMVNSCGLKEVTLDAGANAAMDFHIFTEVPIPARYRILVTDNVNTEISRARGFFGDKPGIPLLPVSVKDYTGKEIVRVYTDPDGMAEVLVPSTYRVNVPNPTGVSPNVLLLVANDPGPADHPDPHFNVNYDTLVQPLDVWPGKMTLGDIALTPVNGFLATQKIDCGPGAGTPQIGEVSQPYGNNSGTSSIEIRGTGFGAIQGTGKVTLDGTALTVTNWTDTRITVKIPTTVTPGPRQLLVTSGNGEVSPSGLTIHVTGAGYNPTFVTVTSTIQAAINGAAAGSVILIPPGSYRENLIVWKAITLQGYGPSLTVVDGAFTDPLATTVWTDKMNTLVANGDVTLLPGQSFGVTAGAAAGMSTITVLAKQGAATGLRIDGLTIQGARIAGGIHINSFADNATISNNVIKNNFGGFNGGISLGFPDLGDNQISNPRIHHNQITHNGSLSRTGGIGIFHGIRGYQIDHNLICANGSEEFGGGIAHYGTNLGTTGRIEHNDVLFNFAFTEGAGISVQGQPPANPADPSPGSGPVVLDSNRVQGNFGFGEGAGLAISRAGTYPIQVLNNIIVNNLTTSAGGGMSIRDSSNVAVVNNTLAKNNSTSTSILDLGPHSAGLVSFVNSIPFQNSLPPGSPSISDPFIFNNIFWDNMAYRVDVAAQTLNPTGPFDLEVFQSTATLTHVSRNFLSTAPTAVVNPSASNQIGTDPLFVTPYDNTINVQFIPVEVEAANPTPVYYSFGPLTPTGDYHLLGWSPAVDYGRSTFEGGAITAPATDFDGETRPIGTYVDAGADERPYDLHPSADAGGPYTGYEMTPVTFDASASQARSPITSYTWNFGDGSAAVTVAVPTMTHTYQDNGTYNVTLTVTDSGGPATTRYEETNGAIAYTGTWLNATDPNESGGSYKYSSQTGATATLTFTGTGVSWISDPWNDLGKAKVYIDGVLSATVDLYSATGMYQQVVYTKSGLVQGTHTLKIEVTGTKNPSSAGTTIDIDAFDVVSTLAPMSGTDTTTATIANLPPTAYAGPDVTCTAGVPCAFSGSASDPSPVDSATLQYSWNFGDGSPAVTGTLTPTHTYTALSGTYIVTLTVTDKDGGSASDTAFVTVNGPPTITSTPVTTVAVGDAYVYQVTAQDPDGDILTYGLTGPAWLSINTTTGLITGTPTAANVGSYTVTVTASDGRGGVATQTYTLTVIGDAIFSDGFESGDLTAWSSSVGSANLTVREDAPVTIGTKGLQVAVNASAHYLVDATPAADPSYHARFYFDPNTATLGTSVQTLFTGVQGTADLFRIQIQAGTGGNYQIRSQVLDNGTTYASSPWTTLSDDIHSIEVAWNASTDTVTGNGNLILYVDDGAPASALTGIQNSTRMLEEVRLGEVATTGTLSGNEYMDDFVSTRNSSIGPALLQLPFNGTTIDTSRWTEIDANNILTQNEKLIWLSGATTSNLTGTLNGKFNIGADFDVRVAFSLPTWAAPTGASGSQSLRFIASSATGSGTPDTNNRLTIARKRTASGSFNGYESVATVGGSSTTTTASSATTTGLFRFTRSGTLVSAYYWDGTSKWVLLKSATLPAGPILLTAEGQVSGGTASIQMQLDTLKLTLGVLGTSTTTRYEETNASVSYTGTWANASDANASAGAYKNSSTTGATATLTFTGSGVFWITDPWNDLGKAKVYIDGALDATVSLYSPSNLYKQVVYGKTGLTSGTHTLKIEVTGTKVTSSAGTIIDVDAFDVITGSVGPTITTASLPGGDTGTPYSATLTASSGTTPYSWSITAGSLPPGLGLTATTGVISGTPTTAGTYSFTATVTDNLGQTNSKALSIVISTPPTVTTTLLSNGRVGVAYSAALTASGGTIPYSWSLAAGSLPAGLSLAPATGVISGTPSTAGTFGFTVQVTDAAGGTATQALSILINPNSLPNVPTVPGGPTSGSTGVSYSYSTSTTDPDGDQVRYTFDWGDGTTTSTALANSGTTMSATHSWSAAGSYPVKVMATDAYGASSAYSASITVVISVTTRYEENSPTVVYTGSWAVAADPNASGGSYRYSNAAGAAATFTFTGTGVKWISDRWTDLGIASVYIDGVLDASVDLYSGTGLYQQTVYTKTGLVQGTHTVKIVVTGTKNASSSNTFIDIDAFDVVSETTPTTTHYEETSGSVAYLGSWGSAADPNASGGSYKYSSDSTTPASATLTFTGTGVTWISDVWSDLGIANVYIDGVLNATVDLYSATGKYQQVVYTKTGLTPGAHTLKIEVSGTRNAGSLGFTIDVDAFDVTN